jgi:hypothetical protein
MLRAVLLAAAALALGAPATAHAANDLFTVAGGGVAQLRDGLPAGLAGLPESLPVAARPDGEFLIAAQARAWRVDAQGTLHRVAGVDRSGYTGDGGPATLAEVNADGLAALPGGGFLILDQSDQRVRMVDPDGIITTVAGGGTSTADGIRATQAALDFPDAIAVLPGGGFVIGDDGDRVREVRPDGRIRTIAGGGEDEDARGQPATALDLDERDVAALRDGSVLVAESYAGRVDRIAPDGTVRVAAQGHDIEPDALAALPDGGFAFSDEHDPSHRIWQVSPSGAMHVVAGGGPFARTALDGLAQLVDGGPATSFDLPDTEDLAALPDGGLLYSYNSEQVSEFAGLVAYVAPAQPGRLALGVRRDGGRVFGPGRRATLHVALTQPATVRVTVAGHTLTRALPAGRSSVRLPARLPRKRDAVTLAATDAAGRQVVERIHVFPVGWLPSETGELVAGAVFAHSFVEDCDRADGRRLDCRLDVEPERCREVSVAYVHGRLRVGAGQCDGAPEPHLHALRRRDWVCRQAGCPPPPLFGRVGEAALIPTG